MLAASPSEGGSVTELYPAPAIVDADIPERARSYLLQALDTIHAPSAAVVMAASAIDAMLKEKGYKEGKLYNRIQQAASDNLITDEMASWAHDVRLDANDERHADEEQPMADGQDAKRVIEFAQALGQFLFVLPARVRRGRAKAVPEPAKETK